MPCRLLLLSLVSCIGSSRAAPTATATATGPPVMVYDWKAQHCPKLPQPWCAVDVLEGCDPDTVDAPMRMWRRSGGDGRVFSLASVDLGSRGLSGPDPLRLTHECAVYANSTRLEAFSDYAKYEWIQGGRYFKENNTVYALTHMEWDCKNAVECPFFGRNPPLTFFSAVTLMMSSDGGRSWTHARPPPLHLVAAQPYQWNQTLGRGTNFGFRSPSGVVEARDGSGWFYATVTAGWGRATRLGQRAGACLMRTRDLTDPTGWRAWGGSAFDVSLAANPYTDPTIVPADHLCEPFTDTTYPSLLWSSFYNQYMLFGTAGGSDSAGWAFSLTPDLAMGGEASAWSPPVPVNLDGHFSATGNATITRSGPFTGRFFQPLGHTSPQVWWEDAAHTVKRPVGSCTPCPGVDACKQPLIQLPVAEVAALKTKGEFSCGAIGMYNTTGYHRYLYPTLVDPTSPSDNFDEVGQTAQLFLVASECVSAQGSPVARCSPFDYDGLLVRDLVRAPIRFA